MDFERAFSQTFRGCVLITKEGEAVFSRASGQRDLANGIPNTMDTRFATASAGKAFVAVGVLKLISQGALRLTDTLGSVLPMDWRAVDSALTVEELLTHTSGIPDYFDESVMNEYEELWLDLPSYRMRRNADLLPLFINKPMMYPHGAKFQYNNTGYIVLAMMLEKRTGMPFDAYLQKNVFDPCAMSDTGYYELDRLPARCANHYLFDKTRGEYRTNIYCVEAKGTGAGGAYTTVGDIMRFWNGVLSCRLLPDQWTSTMLARHAGDNQGNYGYGFWLRKLKGGGYAPYFQGCDPGVSFMTELWPESDMIATAVSNFGDDVWGLMERLSRIKSEAL